MATVAPVSAALANHPKNITSANAVSIPLHEAVICEGKVYDVASCTIPSDLLKPFTSEWYIYAGLVLGCITFAALAAGLTMGLVSVDMMKLRVTLEAVEELSDDEDVAHLEEEKARLQQESGTMGDGDVSHSRAAVQRQIDLIDDRLEQAQDEADIKAEATLSRKILPLVEKHHLLLVTLLLTNALANECMPIFLDRLVPSWLAVLLSVTFVLVFGEIVPSAVFTGKNQLRIAACFTPFVWCLIYVTGVISWPIAKSLDCIFHHEGDDDGDAFNRDELKAFIRLHGQSDAPRTVLHLRTTENPMEDRWRRDRSPGEAERERLRSIVRLLRLPDGGWFSKGSGGIHHARFCQTTAKELECWLQELLDDYCWQAEGTTWQIMRHPLTKEERLHFNKTRACISFSDGSHGDKAEEVCRIINSRIGATDEHDRALGGGGSWLHGWVRVQASASVQHQGTVRLNKLSHEECAIITGSLDLCERTCGMAALSFDSPHPEMGGRPYMLPHNMVLDKLALEEIVARGYSRIPVYEVDERQQSCTADVSLGGKGKWGEWNAVTNPPPSWGPGQWCLAAVGSPPERLRSIHHWDKWMKDSMAEAQATGRAVYTIYDADQSRSSLCGMLMSKRLITLDPAKCSFLSEVDQSSLPPGSPLASPSSPANSIYPLVLAPECNLLQALTYFRRVETRDDSSPVSHLAIVANFPDELRKCWKDRDAGDRAWAAPIKDGRIRILGMLTLEDVIEEFLGDIEDESDRQAKDKCCANQAKMRRDRAGSGIRASMADRQTHIVAHHLKGRAQSQARPQHGVRRQRSASDGGLRETTPLLGSAHGRAAYSGLGARAVSSIPTPTR